MEVNVGASQRRTLGMIYGPINYNDIWRTRHNNLYTLQDELDSQSDKTKKTEVTEAPVQNERSGSLQKANST